MSIQFFQSQFSSPPADCLLLSAEVFRLGASAEMGDVPEAGQLVTRPLKVTAHDLATVWENHFPWCPRPLPVRNRPGIAWHTLSGSGLDPHDFSAASATYSDVV